MPLNYFVCGSLKDNKHKSNPDTQDRLQEIECSVLAIPGQEIQLYIIHSPGIRHA
jgi:hypothetical protein